MSMIVEVLETYLKEARAGKIKHLAISVAGDNNFAGYGFVGVQPYEALNMKGVTAMQAGLQRSIDNWTPPPPDPTLDASYVTYHLGAAPNGFDFVTWLATQDALREQAGVPGPMKVAFWNGKKSVPSDWLHVYREILGVFGGVEDNKALGRAGTGDFLTKKLVGLVNEGIPVPKLKPKGEWNLPKDVITITLREVDYEPHRNSDHQVWLRIAAYLQHKGHRVVIVRDTCKADEPLHGFETCPMASKNIDARMFLYANAKLNLFVSNGPCTLAWFSDKPFLCFTPPEAEDSAYVANRPSFWTQIMGIEVGQQFPWFTPQQRIVWEKADYKNVQTAINALNIL